MGLFDKLFGKNASGSSKSSEEITQKEPETSLREKSSIEKAIAERKASISLNQCMKIPFGDVAALGTTFAQLIPSLRTITTTGVGYIPVNMGPGAVLKTAGAGRYYGAHVTEAGKSVLTKWEKMGSTSTVMPIDPGLIMMAAMLANIEKKLDTIQDTQMKILSFLEQDKQAEQQGNLNVLNEILHGYKFNWDNDQYLRNHHMKVLDIKQTSEKNLIFYQEQIASAIKKLPTVYLDQAVKGAVSDLGKLFSNYRMVLYEFAFSSFLEVMLLGNFRQEYLEQVAGKVEGYDKQYQEQFSECRAMLKKFTTDSLETKVVNGIGNAGKALGKLIASSPVLAQGSVDEWFRNAGEKLLQDNDKKIENTVALFAVDDNTGSEAFVDSIKNVGIIANHTTDILFDENTIYLASATA